MSESSSWQTLRASLKGEAAPGWPIHIQRFEDKSAIGLPDANICYKGRETWVEGKFIEELPKRLTTLVKVPLSVEQCTWLENRARCDGNCVVWVRIMGVGWLLLVSGFREARSGLLWEELVRRHELFKSSKELARRLLDGY